MKTVFEAIIFFTALHLFAGEQPQVKIFPFKSAVIEYKYEASFKGTHVTYIDDYGYRQADYIKKKENFGGNSGWDYETIIRIGSKAYTINLEDKTIAVGRNETYGYYLRNRNRPCTDVSNALFKAAGGWKITGTESFLGKEGTLWKSGKNTMVTWKGLLLQKTINFMTMTVEKAVKLKLNTTIPENVFEIPEGLRYLSTDVYQGISGLKLDFGSSADTVKQKDNNITVAFNSKELSGCNNFVYFTDTGGKVLSPGINDYNKIDNLIIKAMKRNMTDNKVTLPLTETLVFFTAEGFPGKLQIEHIDKNGFKIRYLIFNCNGTVLRFSNGTEDALQDDFDISPGRNEVIVRPKIGTRCLVLD